MLGLGQKLTVESSKLWLIDDGNFNDYSNQIQNSIMIRNMNYYERHKDQRENF